jgi:uncharacterized protein YndB with AHSA1/START domain
MKALFRLVIVGLVLGGIVWLYGRSLPREHVVSMTITLVAPADTVWRMVRNIGGTPGWWDGVSVVTRVSGSRETWDQVSRSGTVRFEVRSETPGRRLVTEIVNTEQDDFGGTWTYDVVASGSGTEVTVTEEGWVDSPFFRVVMKFKGAHGTIDGYLRSLAAHFGEVATPRRG